MQMLEHSCSARGDLSDPAKDPVAFPRFNREVAKALPEQMLRTIADHLVTRQGDRREPFTTRHTFLTRPLGMVYQQPVRARTGWEPYSFAEGDDRAGLLSQAGFLALAGWTEPALVARLRL